MASDLATLITGVRSTTPAQQRDAAEKLAQLGEDAQAAALPLVEACATTDAAAREAIVAALEGLGAPAAADTKALAALVANPALDVGYWAATLLGRSGAEAKPAVAELATALANHGELAVRQRAAWALGKIGPDARAAVPTLETAAKNSDARLARLAAEAIEQINS